MEADLKSLKIDRKPLRHDEPAPWARRIILGGIAIFVLLCAGAMWYKSANAAIAVTTVRLTAEAPAAGAPAGDTVLNATGYVVAAHKIQVASKVVGKVAFIGVEKGDRVREGDILVRLEDDEYRAHLQQARGQLQSLQARLAELEAGSRPEEIAVAQANLEQAKAELENARINMERTQQLVREQVFAQQTLDDALALQRAREARVRSLERTFELVRIGPRREVIDAVKGQIEQFRGAVAFAETQLANTIIRAPVTGTILERIVERGEFVTTGFVGDRGAKGFVVSLADLNDLEVELDISQSDFNKLSGLRQKAQITVDAYPDRRWNGEIYQIAPEADRQKATVQVKVKVANPDEFLRPEMNATVAFLSEAKAAPAGQPAAAAIYVPAGAIRDGKVFVVLNGRAMARPVRTGPSSTRGLRVEDGLFGGEDLVLDPPAGLADGARVAPQPR
ncbi:MAG: efflux RND transporter periplasmic adaptor subunit [Bryobacteraceae bacterium]|nr:efflux RND transporter periplasmic adaptor subunit [Bryobacteraceae bacterium]